MDFKGNRSKEEKMKNNYKSNSQGITLLALIITIIVLVILAGVTISTLVGNDGIIKNADNAVGKYNDKANQEQEIFNTIEGYLEKYTNEENNLTKVYANLYKISDTKYHLIYNSTGNVTSGYNEADRVWKEECTNGYSSFKSVYWANNKEGESYIKDLINTCVIEDKIIPKSTSYYFYKLDKIAEIKNLENIDTSNVTNMGSMFSSCLKLTTIYVSDLWKTGKVVSSDSMFWRCSALKGAISYDSAKEDVTYANYTTGYLTYKAR